MPHSKYIGNCFTFDCPYTLFLKNWCCKKLFELGKVNDHALTEETSRDNHAVLKSSGWKMLTFRFIRTKQEGSFWDVNEKLVVAWPDKFWIHIRATRLVCVRTFFVILDITWKVNRFNIYQLVIQRLVPQWNRPSSHALKDVLQVNILSSCGKHINTLFDCSFLSVGLDHNIGLT